MKIQCVLCKEIVEIGPFEPTGAGVTIRCSACTDSFFLPRAGVATAVGASTRAVTRATPATPGEGAGGTDCPKCGVPVVDESPACAVCGLLREHFDSLAAEHKRDEDPQLEALWEACESDWENVAVHDAFAARASGTGAFAGAARHYRQVLKARPTDPMAARQLERVTKMAEVALLSKPPEAIEEGAGAYRGVVILLVLMLALGGVAGIYALMKGKDSEKLRRETPTKTSPARR